VTLRSLLTRFVAVCNAVAYAHNRGVLHRDLKPSNVMLGKYGETLVVDWGLAKVMGQGTSSQPVALSDEPSLVPFSGDSSLETQMGSTLGTPTYMSPEQASGQRDRLGHATDIYGLGATLYTILVGRAPIESQNQAEILERARKGDWLLPRRAKPNVPRALDAICCKAMAMSPADRYPTALALAADVEAWLADEPVRAWQEPWTVRSRRWLARHRAQAAAVAAFVVVASLALGVGVVLLTAANERERDARHLAEIKESEAREQRDELEHQRDRLRYTLYVSSVNLAQQEWENGNVAHARELLDAFLPNRSDGKDLRGWEWHFLDRLCRSDLRTVRGLPVAVRTVMPSPNGALLVSAGEDGNVRLWDAATAKEVRVLQGHSRGVLSAIFNGDGSRVLSSGRDGTVRIWQTATGQQLRALPAHSGEVYCVAYSPDGAKFLLGGSDGTLHEWTADGTRELRMLRSRDVVLHVAYRPDGSQFASAGRDGTVRVWDAATGNLVHILQGHSARAIAVAYSPDGSRLASCGGDGFVRIWDAASGAALRAIQAHVGEVLSLAYSPDGIRLASAGEDGVVRVWHTPSGAELHAYKGHTGEIMSIAYTSDGTRLVSAGVDDHEIHIWDASDVGEMHSFRASAGEIMGLAYSADGSQLAAAGSDRTVRIWEAVRGNELRTFRREHGISSLAYYSDGTRLATGEEDGTVRICDPNTGVDLFAGRVHGGEVGGVAFSPDGGRLVSAGAEGAVRVCTVPDGKEFCVLNGHQGAVYTVAYSPDGNRVASGGEDGMIRAWDLVSRRQIGLLRGHAGGVACVVYSPDGSRLASAGHDGTVRIWDALAGDELLVLKGHTGWLSNVAFSPDGTRVASAGHDRSLHVWDAVNGELLLVFKGRKGWGAWAAYSPVRGGLASGGFDGTIQILDGRPWTPQIQEEKEAFGLVHGLFARPLLKNDVLERIRRHNGIVEAVRRRALDLAEHYQDDPVRFYQAAWNIVRYPDAPVALYRLALGWVQTADRLAPEHGPYLTALGIAEYRLGQAAEALTALTRAARLDQGSAPANLAFQAMAHHALGHRDEAQTMFHRLQKTMEDPRVAKNEEALAFQSEAEKTVRRSR
jgi:eukaryotic-like serine/threonine-protein kinase